MAIFGKKEDKKDKGAKTSKTGVSQQAEKKSPSAEDSMLEKSVRGISYEVVLHPRITEKATNVAEDGNVYTFDVDPRATKHEIAKAIQKLYNVTPVKVRTARIPYKMVSVRGGRDKGKKPGGKKAYVYLKKGDTIEFV